MTERRTTKSATGSIEIGGRRVMDLNARACAVYRELSAGRLPKCAPGGEGDFLAGAVAWLLSAPRPQPRPRGER
jgi:hypothetical protein